MDGAQAGRDGRTGAGADTRLIERWLPIAALGIESIRERTPMTPFPAPNRLHVWWARRPLVASRAAVLASVLPADADRDRFLHVLGIHGDPVAAKVKIDRARRTGVRVANPYDWDRAFSYRLDTGDRAWLKGSMAVEAPNVLDPTAGGGSIPFESARLGLPTLANDLNPVAALILKATVEWPMEHGAALRPAFDKLAKEFRARLQDRLWPFFPQRDAPDRLDLTYLWARTIRCPHCEGLVPLSPNWRLAPDGTGVRLHPQRGSGPGDPARRCTFEIVPRADQHAKGTVADGDGLCPFSDCGRVIEGDDIKRQAQAGGMGEQLFAVVFKRRIETKTKAGKKGRDKWERGYRAPRPEDDNSAEIAARLAEKMPEWTALDFVPGEEISDLSNYDRGHRMYGMSRWVDMFSARHLLCHGSPIPSF